MYIIVYQCIYIIIIIIIILTAKKKKKKDRENLVMVRTKIWMNQ
jgi:hypothetical protein